MRRRLVRMTFALMALLAGISVLLGLKTEEITVSAPTAVKDDSELSQETLHVQLAASVTASPKPTPTKTPAKATAKKPRPTAKPTPKVTKAPAKAPTTSPSKAPVAALPGFAGAVVTAGPYGPVQVQIVTTNGRITSVRAIKLPDGADDIEINDIAVPKLIGQTLERQSAQLDVVSGATYTSLAYIKSLQSAIDASRR